MTGTHQNQLLRKQLWLNLLCGVKVLDVFLGLVPGKKVSFNACFI